MADKTENESFEDFGDFDDIDTEIHNKFPIEDRKRLVGKALKIIDRNAGRERRLGSGQDIQDIWKDCQNRIDAIPGDASCSLGPISDIIHETNQKFCDRASWSHRIKERTGKPESKEQPWDQTNSEYMPNSEAVVAFTDTKMQLATLSKLLTPDGCIRYMRNGQRCRVHIGDFREYAKTRYVSDAHANELADEVLAAREARKEEDRHKGRTGK